MPNIWSNQAYMQGFASYYISFKRYIKMFDQIEIYEYVSEVIVKTSYQNPTRE